jgi:NADP-dependent 3-hydroxy acid dehydrogenase YdfG/AraC-like DNA-binding protein
MKKTLLITGASSGIGKAAARRFQAEGWNVIATMRSPERETELTVLDGVLVTWLDVLDVASITAAVDAGLHRFGRIDALLNYAGYGAYGPLEATPLDKVHRQFDVNVMGVLATMQAVLPHLRRQRSGVIVNVSSIGGKITFPLGTLYHGTKFAVEGLSEALHDELLPLGVSAADVLRRAGLPEDLLAQPEIRLEAAAFHRFWIALGEELAEPLFPLRVCHAARSEAFSPALFAALCSPNFLVAVQRIARYKALVAPMHLRVSDDAKGMTLDLEWPDTAYQPPPSLAVTELLFFVTLARMGTRLAELDAAVTRGQRVRAALLEALPSGQGDMDAVSRKRMMSRRTLQRHLDAEGLSFAGLLRETRQALAQHYLGNTRLPAAEIAFLLGFEEPNSFYRAFRRWTGQTPDATRRQGRAGADTSTSTSRRRP